MTDGPATGMPGRLPGPAQAAAPPGEASCTALPERGRGVPRQGSAIQRGARWAAAAVGAAGVAAGLLAPLVARRAVERVALAGEPERAPAGAEPVGTAVDRQAGLGFPLGAGSPQPRRVLVPEIAGEVDDEPGGPEDRALGGAQDGSRAEPADGRRAIAGAIPPGPEALRRHEPLAAARANGERGRERGGAGP